jgi:hypothetical protein
VIEKESEAHRHPVAVGLGHLPLEALPFLEGAWKSAEKKDVKTSLHRAIVGVLARAASRAEVWDERWDSFLTMDIEFASYDYPYVEPLIRKAIHGLPSKRGENVLLRELDTQNPKAFGRAMMFVGSHPTHAVMQAAFRGLLVVEDRIPTDQVQMLGRAMRGIPEVDEGIKWVWKAGGGGHLTQVFENAVGGPDQLAALKEAMASEGDKMTKTFDEIDKLIAMSKAALGDEKGVPIYVLRQWEDPPEDLAPLGINRIGGLPPGVDADAWPELDGEPMVHLFTLDLATMPELRERLGGKRSFSFFMANPDMNEAYEPFNSETAVVMLDDDQVKKPGQAPEDTEVREEEYFEPVKVYVPENIFENPEDDLHGAIYTSSARVLGEPIWLQGEEEGGEQFVMQLDEGFVDVNLGDMGVLYVYDDGGFWQCH